MEALKVRSDAFDEGGWIPERYTARGADISPDFELESIAPNAKSIAITLDDASHPLFPNYNHWVIWNIAIQPVIPEAIAHGKFVENLGATQGIAYGRHRYKGPKPPQKSIHIYVFTIYTLDCAMDLDASCRKQDFVNNAEGHILQQATLTGKFQSKRE